MKLADKMTMDKFLHELKKTGQIRSVLFELHPFNCLKAPVCLSSAYISIIISFHQIFLKLGCKVHLGEISHEVENCPDQIICYSS